MKTIKEFLAESSLSKLYSAWQKHDTGTITAFRSARDCGDGIVYTKAENTQRNKILVAKLLRLGFGITKIQGAYIENYGNRSKEKL